MCFCGLETEWPEVINLSACETAIEKKPVYAFKNIVKIAELTPMGLNFKYKNPGQCLILD